MKALRVNFVTPSRSSSYIAATLAAGLLALAVVLGWRTWSEVDLATSLRSERDSLTHRAGAADADRSASGDSVPRPTYFDDALALARLGVVDPAAILKSLESVRTPGLKVVSFEWLADKNGARLEVEAATHSVVLDYLQALNAGESKPRWTLVRSQHQGQGQVAATVQGQWTME